MKDVYAIEKELGLQLITRFKALAGMDISERRKPQDGKINFARFVPQYRLELRVATIPTNNGLEDVVMRILGSSRPMPLDKIGLSPNNLSRLQSAMERPYGMVLCVGPTGSGKTTSVPLALAEAEWLLGRILVLEPRRLATRAAARRMAGLLGEDVGATGVKVRPNALPKEVPVEKTLAQIGKSLRELGDFGAQHGQQIRLEVHGTGTNLVPHCKTIMDAADHKNVGLCWNFNQSDIFGDGWDANFNLVKHKIFTVHMRDLYLEEYPFRKLLTGLNEIGFSGFTFAEIPPSTDPIRVMKYYRSLWLAYQGLL